MSANLIGASLAAVTVILIVGHAAAAPCRLPPEDGHGSDHRPTAARGQDAQARGERPGRAFNGCHADLPAPAAKPHGLKPLPRILAPERDDR